MSLIRISPIEPTSIPDLRILALRYLYEEEKMSLEEVDLMRYSVNYYADKIREKNEKKASRFIILPGDEENHLTEQELALKNIGELLVRIDSNTLEPKTKRSVLMAKFGLYNWRKKHNIPGAHNKEDYEKAQIMYEKYKEKNPEQEDMGKKNGV